MLSERSIVEYTHDYDYPTIDDIVYRLLIIYHAPSAKPSDFAETPNSDRMKMTPLRVNWVHLEFNIFYRRRIFSRKFHLLRYKELSLELRIVTIGTSWSSEHIVLIGQTIYEQTEHCLSGRDDRLVIWQSEDYLYRNETDTLNLYCIKCIVMRLRRPRWGRGGVQALIRDLTYQN